MDKRGALGIKGCGEILILGVLDLGAVDRFGPAMGGMLGAVVCVHYDFRVFAASFLLLFHVLMWEFIWKSWDFAVCPDDLQTCNVLGLHVLAFLWCASLLIVMGGVHEVLGLQTQWSAGGARGVVAGPSIEHAPSAHPQRRAAVRPRILLMLNIVFHLLVGALLGCLLGNFLGEWGRTWGWVVGVLVAVVVVYDFRLFITIGSFIWISLLLLFLTFAFGTVLAAILTGVTEGLWVYRVVDAIVALNVVCKMQGDLQSNIASARKLVGDRRARKALKAAQGAQKRFRSDGRSTLPQDQASSEAAFPSHGPRVGAARAWTGVLHLHIPPSARSDVRPQTVRYWYAPRALVTTEAWLCLTRVD